MKVGDLVKPVSGEFPQVIAVDATPQVGIIIEVLDHVEVPPSCKILWPDGGVHSDWADELEVINEDR